MDDDLRTARSVLVSSMDGLLAALDRDGDAAAIAPAVEDAMAELHELLEGRYGMGLLSDWTDPGDPYDGPVVIVRLTLDVFDEETRDDVMALVDERLCQGLDEDRFAILSTTRLFPGARGSAADTGVATAPAVQNPTSGGLPTNPSELSNTLEKLHRRLIDDLDSLLEALERYGENPRNTTRRRVYKRQERFEARMAKLHRKVLRRTGTPLVTTWAYTWDELPWSGPVILRTIFDVAESETQEDLLAAIADTLDGLAPDHFALATALCQ